MLILFLCTTDFISTRGERIRRSISQTCYIQNWSHSKRCLPQNIPEDSWLCHTFCTSFILPQFVQVTWWDTWKRRWNFHHVYSWNLNYSSYIVLQLKCTANVVTYLCMFCHDMILAFVFIFTNDRFSLTTLSCWWNTRNRLPYFQLFQIWYTLNKPPKYCFLWVHHKFWCTSLMLFLSINNIFVSSFPILGCPCSKDILYP